MDPLLELLVEQGVVTAEQARAVQAEYDRREAAKAAEATSPESVTAEASQVATTELAPVEPSSPQVAEAQHQPEAAPAKTKWYDKIDFKGDLRLRYEGFWVEGLSDNNHRSRLRLRARAGMYTDVTDWMKVGLQLRSGDPDDPVSDNQSADGGFSMKQIAISEAYAAFTPTDWLDIHAGKFDPQKLWIVSDMQWDDDVTVEGLMENLDFGAFKSSLYQFALEERAGGDDSMLYGGQVAGVFDIGSKHTITFGAGYDDWVNPQYVADLTLTGKLQGNWVSNILDDDFQLVSDFQIGSLFAEWKYELSERWPIKVTAFGYHNFGANEYEGKTYDDGYFLRLQIGDYKKKGQSRVARDPVLLAARCALLRLHPVGHDHGLGCRRLPFRSPSRLRHEELLQLHLVSHQARFRSPGHPHHGSAPGGLHHSFLDVYVELHGIYMHFE